MTRDYAEGRLSRSVCDRCGIWGHYRDMIEDGNIPGIFVHPKCYDSIDPYKLPARLPDNYCLAHPRPDTPLHVPNSLLTDDGYIILFDDDSSVLP